MRIVPSYICSAFEPSGVIGSKVINHAEFNRVLHEAVGSHDFASDRIPGQAFIQIPAAIPFVSSGTGKRLQEPACYVLRVYRENVSAFLKRDFAAPVTGCAAVVYTKDAYFADPDITTDEMARITAQGLTGNGPITHVLVTVLAFSGSSTQLGPHRFTANLAGGNKEAQVWTADEIRAKARDIMAYENEWVTVADPV